MEACFHANQINKAKHSLYFVKFRLYFSDLGVYIMQLRESELPFILFFYEKSENALP